MSRVPEKFIKNLQGKQFVLYSGLLELAHQDGLSHSNTEILQFPIEENKNTCVVKAIVTTKKGTFSGIGDASPASVPNKNIAVHSIRMAETRAMARALRVATNVEMTAFEELGSDLIIDDYQAPKPEPKPKAPAVMPSISPIEPSDPAQNQSYREQQAAELRNLRMKITAQAKAINFVGDDLKKWITDTHKTTWEAMTTGKAEIILADLVAMA